MSQYQSNIWHPRGVYAIVTVDAFGNNLGTYIGETYRPFKLRWQEHIRKLKSKRHRQKKLQTLFDDNATLLFMPLYYAPKMNLQELKILVRQKERAMWLYLKENNFNLINPDPLESTEKLSSREFRLHRNKQDNEYMRHINHAKQIAYVIPEMPQYNLQVLATMKFKSFSILQLHVKKIAMAMAKEKYASMDKETIKNENELKNYLVNESYRTLLNQGLPNPLDQIANTIGGISFGNNWLLSENAKELSGDKLPFLP